MIENDNINSSTVAVIQFPTVIDKDEWVNIEVVVRARAGCSSVARWRCRRAVGKDSPFATLHG
jgi:hypothetical protein